jgi:uncharacterized protein
MSEQDRYIPGVPCWVDTNQADPEAAKRFYGGLFDWTFEDTMPPEAPGRYYIASRPGGSAAAIASQPNGTSGPATWDTYVLVEDVDETVEKVRAAGGTVVSEPHPVGPAGLTAVIADPAGATLCLWQAGTHTGAAVVNEHGSVNFNNLHTNDPEGAKAFYGAVFGWELLGDGTMWALPPYGDFLEKLRPGMRAQMAEFGAPERFEEVVASLVRIPDDEPDTKPHWSVTFGVDDADEIARRATELGGEVLVAPFDAPWVRMTVIRDPQGATFTANKFVPENRDL